MNRARSTVGRILLAVLSLAPPAALLMAIRTCLNTRNYYWGPVDRAREAGFTSHDLLVRPGTNLHYVRGPMRGQPGLLLIPGQGSLWHDYAKVLPDLANDFDVAVVDVHGHGGSSWNRSDYRATVIADDLTRLGREVFQAPFLVAGHSSGGLLAVQMAAAHPAEITGVIIEDAPFFATDPDRVPGTFAGQDNTILRRYLEQNEESDYLVYSLRDSYIGTMFGRAWESIAHRIIEQRRKNPGATPNIWWLGPSINRIWESISHPYDRWWSYDFFISRRWHEGFEQSAALGNVAAPTVFIKASTRYSADGILLAALTDDDAARVDSLLPDNRIVTVKAGHDVHFDKPDVYLDIVTGFNRQIRRQLTR